MDGAVMSKLPRPPQPDDADLFGWAVTDKELKFADFIRENPQFWQMFVKLAERRIAKGAQNYSARDILAVMRWETAESSQDGQGWKVNNNWSSYLARHWVHLGMHPELPDFFEFRRAPKAEQEMGTVVECRDSGQKHRSPPGSEPRPE